MLYLWIKYLHILSSAVLFGTGLGTAAYMFIACQTKNAQIIAAVTRQVVLADWLFTGTSGLLQPITGLVLVYLGGYSLSSLWLMGALIGYLIAAFCWFPVVYLQIKIHKLAKQAASTNTPLPALYDNYYRYWFWLGWPAFFSLLIVFYLMTNKPV